MASIAASQLKQLHKKVVNLCANRGSFKASFVLARKHIGERAAEANQYVRFALETDEKVAALITHGKLNEERSRSMSPIELAIEGKFLNLEVVDWSNLSSISTKIVELVCARVIVKEGRPKHLIISIYPETNLDPSLTPEVPNDIWL